MALQIYNTLGRKKSEFKPINKGKISLYTCGPTVYLFAHIGNFVSFIREDFIRRYLEYKGYEVRHIMNITDVGHLTSDADTGEDKIAKAAQKEKKTPAEIAEFYTEQFMIDSKKLNLKPAHKYPRATKYIQDMIEMTETLIDKGMAYESNGNVFFDITKFKDYGKLSGQTPDKITTGQRLEPHPDKKHPGDFALWLKAPKEHLMQWDSPWGMGYPGWHLECSGMSMKLLGDTMDIHTGGEDHIFPHHENEIAQSEGTTGKPFSNTWMHMKFMLIDGEKMSKSKGNIYTLSEVEEKGFSPLVFRFFLFTGHYRSQLSFNWKALEDARDKLNRLIEFKKRMEAISEPGPIHQDIVTAVDKAHDNFGIAMDDDFNTPKATDTIFTLVKEINALADANKVNTSDTKIVLKLLKKFDKVLAVLDYQPISKISDSEIKGLVDKRNEARAKKDFAEADKIRDQLLEKGVEIKDSADGTTWKIK